MMTNNQFTKDMNIISDKDVMRYYNIVSQIKKFGGDTKNRTGDYENYLIWDNSGKNAMKQYVKNELPILEEELKKIEEIYYSTEEVEKREEKEFEKKFNELYFNENILNYFTAISFDNSIKFKGSSWIFSGRLEKPRFLLECLKMTDSPTKEALKNEIFRYHFYCKKQIMNEIKYIKKKFCETIFDKTKILLYKSDIEDMKKEISKLIPYGISKNILDKHREYQFKCYFLYKNINRHGVQHNPLYRKI